MTIPLLLKLFVIVAGIGVAGVLLYLVRALVLTVRGVHRTGRAARPPQAGPTSDELLAAVQRYMAGQGRQATADRIGEIRLAAAIRAAHPLVLPRRSRRRKP